MATDQFEGWFHLLHAVELFIRIITDPCSKIYSSIKVESLAELLHISLDRAQTIVATMIVEDQLPADIDQVAGLVIFTASASPILESIN